MKTCNWRDCTNKYYAKFFCRRHYRLISREHARYWEKTKADPIKYLARKEYQRKWSTTNKRDYRAHSDKIYFGGLREKVILRDGECCRECGMTRNEHVSTWKIDLHVNHIDHSKRNELDNLETLCIRCHARKSHYKGSWISS